MWGTLHSTSACSLLLPASPTPNERLRRILSYRQIAARRQRRIPFRLRRRYFFAEYDRSRQAEAIEFDPLEADARIPRWNASSRGSIAHEYRRYHIAPTSQAKVSLAACRSEAA